MARLVGLIQRRALLLVLVAAIFFAVSALVGGGVAARLDPFGVDDPATESVIADQHLEHAGFRETSVVVLVEHVDPRTADGRARIAAITRTLQRDPDVASVNSYLTARARDFVSRDGQATYLAVGLKPTADRARQYAAEQSPTRSPTSRESRSGAPRSPSARSTSRSSTTCARPSCTPSRSSSCCRSSSSAASSRHSCRCWSVHSRSSAPS
jgi:hypothetical protein